MRGRPQRDVPATVAADLSPFLPRLIGQWAAETPEAKHRAIPGTLVFTDLSGFTALSEHLASQGKVGAEQLTDHLDATFTELLTVAGSYGGSLIKFGGDALLLLFWDDDHEVRAAQAAVEMQSGLERIGRISTPAGEVQLRMSVGAHRGNIDFFLVGSDHRELILAGPEVSRTVAIEARAEAGEIRLSAELAGALDAGLLGERSADAPLLVVAPGVAADAPRTTEWPPGADPARYVPSMLADHLASGVELAEHRQMAVGFLHLSDLDGLIEVVGPERAADELHDMVSHVQDTFAEHGVAFVSTDVYEGGPKIVCATGAVRSFENDDERLLRAIRAVVDRRFGIAVRAGIHRGHGFCGYVGPPFRRTFVTIGDVVNTAARVMSRAAPGEILATGAPLALSATMFERTELPPFQAKGKTQPLVAYRIGAILEEDTARDLESIPLVDRESELAELAERVEPLREGRGCVVDLVGEAGVGKTRLVVELSLRSPWVEPHEGRCGRYAASTPFFPFRRLMGDLVGGRDLDALRTLVLDVAPGLEPDIPLIALTLGLDIEPSPEIAALSAAERRTRLHDAVSELLRTTITAPTGWLIDDAQWIDPASAELIRHLGTALDDVPLVVFVTRRPSGTETFAPNGPLELEGLPDEAAATLLEAASSRHLLRKEIGRLVERAHGNPHFLIELAEAMGSGGDLDRLPDSLEAMLAARIDALPQADRRTLRHLAVVGSRFQPQVAMEIVPDLPDDDAQRTERLGRFIDFSGAEWRFTHSLVRDTAYAGLSFRERRQVHASAGSVIEQHLDPEEVCELLSLHFHEGGVHDKALAYSKIAATRAGHAAANTEAVVFLERCAAAAKAIDDPLELAAQLTGLAWAEVAVGALDGAMEHFEGSVFLKRGLDNRVGVAGSLSGMGTVARARGDYPAAQRHFEEALAILKALTPEELDATASYIGTTGDGLRLQQLGACLNSLGGIAWLQGEYDRAATWFEEALAIRREQGDPAEVAASLDTLGTIAASRSDYEVALARYEESLTIKREVGDKLGLASLLNNLTQVATVLGRMDDARRWSEESLDLRQEIGDREGVASTLNSLAGLAYHQGELDVARNHAEEGLRIARELRGPRQVGALLQTRGSVEQADGDPATAVSTLEAALEIQQQLGDPRKTAETLTPLAHARIDRDELDVALACLKDALDGWGKIGDLNGLSETFEAVARAAAARGDAPRAACLLGAAKHFTVGTTAIPAQSRRDLLTRELVRSMGEDAFDEQHTLGLTIDLERAIELASRYLDEQLAISA